MEHEKLILRPKRPKGEDGHRIFSIRIKDNLMEQIEDISKETGYSRNELINLFLEYAVANCTIEKN